MRKEISLPAAVRVTLGSLEAMRITMGPWAPQSSAARVRMLCRAGSEDSCLGPGGDVWILGGGFEQLTLQSPFRPQLGRGPGGGPVTSLLHLKWDPGGFLSLLVDGMWSHGGQRQKGGI